MEIGNETTRVGARPAQLDIQSAVDPKSTGNIYFDSTPLKLPAAAEKPKRFFAPPPPLELETRVTVDTNTAAYYLNRQPQTMRVWASQENGPLRPIRIQGRLAWPVSELRRLLGCPDLTKPAQHPAPARAASALNSQGGQA